MVTCLDKLNRTYLWNRGSIYRERALDILRALIRSCELDFICTSKISTCIGYSPASVFYFFWSLTYEANPNIRIQVGRQTRLKTHKRNVLTSLCFAGEAWGGMGGVGMPTTNTVKKIQGETADYSVP